MAKDDYVSMQGKITEVLPGNKFRVTIDSDHEILAYLSGKMKQHRIRVIEGDSVDVEVNIYDHLKGRISFRHK
jgi:translation initiation factor IF-1